MSKYFSIFCDVTSIEQIEHAFNKIILRYGGIDIVISNAGAAWTGKMIEVSDKDLRKSFELNFFTPVYSKVFSKNNDETRNRRLFAF